MGYFDIPIFAGRSSLTTGKQVQQTHRFVLNIKGVDCALIQNVSTPKYKIESTSYDILEYKVNYPKKLIWGGPITFDMVQIIDEQLITTTMGYLIAKVFNSNFYQNPMGISTESDNLLGSTFPSIGNAMEYTSNFVNSGFAPGYQRKANEGSIFDLSKQKLSSQLGVVTIKTLDTEGLEYESWRLNGAYISALTPADLNYGDEKIAMVKVELTYDNADYGFRGVYGEGQPFSL